MFDRLFKLFKGDARMHWYTVTYHYQSKTSGVRFDYPAMVGIVQQEKVLNARALKKAIPPLHKIAEVRHLLDGGTLKAEVQCYLGHFSA
jgi:hypothetical protein